MQDRPGTPLRECPGGPPEAVVRLVAGPLLRQIHAHDVRRMAREESLVLGGIEGRGHRGDHVGDVADGGRVESQGTEWADLGHSTLGWTAGTPMVSGRLIVR